MTSLSIELIGTHCKSIQLSQNVSRTYLGCCLIDISSSFHQNIHHLSVSILTGSIEWTETILYSERELMRHS